MCMPTRGQPRLPKLPRGEETLGANWVRLTLKLAPSAPSGDTVAKAWLLLLIMVMLWAPDWVMVKATLFCTTCPLLNCTEPKLSKGRKPLLELGISSIHSAEDRE